LVKKEKLGRIECVQNKITGENFIVSFMGDKIHHITNATRDQTPDNATQEEREMIIDLYRQWNSENN
jgi:hypothetical protein